MSRRVVLYIDKHVHINDVTFEIYRSRESVVDTNDLLVAEIFEPSALKETFVQSAEKLVRDTHTPYAFYASRHFDEDPFPEVWVGNNEVLPRDILLFSDEKMIEIHNGDLGLADGRSVYMTYHYQAIPFKDDVEPGRSGVKYNGPPATGLQLPLNLTITQDLATKNIVIKYDVNPIPVIYYYRIRAKDSDGNYSPWSVTKSVGITPDPSDIFYRIEKSKDGENWIPVSFSNMLEWYDVVEAVDPPQNVAELRITPLSSKEAEIYFANPWFWWNSIPRQSFRYRIRVEDMQGEHTDWLYIDPIDIFLQPKEVLIRRKIDNGTPSSYDGDDSIDVFRLTASNVDPNQAYLTLVDDQLSEALVYAYTFFYRDELDMDADPLYTTSDHTPWANIILFKGDQKSDNILSDDFLTSFELADRIIEIGTTP